MRLESSREILRKYPQTFSVPFSNLLELIRSSKALRESSKAAGGIRIGTREGRKKLSTKVHPPVSERASSHDILFFFNINLPGSLGALIKVTVSQIILVRHGEH